MENTWKMSGKGKLLKIISLCPASKHRWFGLCMLTMWIIILKHVRDFKTDSRRRERNKYGINMHKMQDTTVETDTSPKHGEDSWAVYGVTT